MKFTVCFLYIPAKMGTPLKPLFLQAYRPYILFDVSLYGKVLKGMINVLEHIPPYIAFSKANNQLSRMFCYMAGHID